MTPLDISHLKRAKRPNNYLVAPEEYCLNASPDEIAPVWECAANVLKERLLKATLDENRVKILFDKDDCLEICQKTPFWGFPDYISITFMDVPDGRSTLAIYSRAKYGYRDFDVNKKRVQRWIGALQA